jgi:hypothetical protein
MLLRFQDGRSFAQGACKFLYRPVTSGETAPRIIVEIQIEGIEAQAIVDTGGAYLVCDPQIADLLDLDPTHALDTDRLHIRGFSVPGSIHRVLLTLMADEGESMELEVTAFVPRSNHLHWDLPSFMGLGGCLERLRFAIDPATDTFYFGTLG